MGRLVVFSRGNGPVLSQDHWVGYSSHDPSTACVRRRVDGGSRQKATRNDYPFGPRMPIWKRRLATLLPKQPSGTSMSRRGNCWDNAVAESFFSSLKKERVKKRIYKNRTVATEDISDYIETFFNQIRRHSHLSGMSPVQYETAAKLHRARSPRNPGRRRTVT